MKLELRDIPLMVDKERMVLENMRIPEWGRHWDQDTIMAYQMVAVMDIYWESHLVQNMDLREDPMLRCQVDKFRVHFFVKNMELRQDPLVICQVDR